MKIHFYKATCWLSTGIVTSTDLKTIIGIRKRDLFRDLNGI